MVPGIDPLTFSNSSNKKLLGAPGLTTRSVRTLLLERTHDSFSAGHRPVFFAWSPVEV